MNRWCSSANLDIITWTATRLHAVQLFKADFMDFKASADQCTQFMTCHSLTLCRSMKTAQKLPQDLHDKIMQFQSFVINQWKIHDFTHFRLETWMKLQCSSTSPLTIMWIFVVNTILVSATGHEKTHFTVVLTFMVDGTKLKAMVIFKRKSMPKDKFPPGLVVHVNPKGESILMVCISDYKTYGLTDQVVWETPSPY